jgi:SAM-dependent methyltransferase
MARRAARRGAAVAVGDAVRLPVATAAVDVVVDFGAVHLIPDWPAALAEIHRVLRPGGAYVFEHIVGASFRRLLPVSTAGFANPNRTGFGRDAFLAALPAHEFTDVTVERPAPGWLLTGLVGDLVGVARA